MWCITCCALNGHIKATNYVIISWESGEKGAFKRFGGDDRDEDGQGNGNDYQVCRLPLWEAQFAPTVTRPPTKNATEAM